MKTKCWCGIEGFVEKRGNNFRIKHYQGYMNSQRIYTVHNISREQLDSLGINKQFDVDPMGINGNQSMGIRDLKSASVDQKVGAGRLAWLGHWLYEPKVAGSSPVRPTCFQK